MNVLLMLLLLLLLLLLLCSAEQRPVPDARVPLDGAQRRLRVGPHAGHGRLRGPRLVAQRRRLRPQRHQVRTPFPQKKKRPKTSAVAPVCLKPASRLQDASCS